MAKNIIPIKQVISYDKDGKIKSNIMIYKIEIDGVTSNRIYTMNVTDGLKTEDTAKILTDSKAHVELGEGITKESV